MTVRYSYMLMHPNFEGEIGLNILKKNIKQICHCASMASLLFASSSSLVENGPTSNVDISKA